MPFFPLGASGIFWQGGLMERACMYSREGQSCARGGPVWVKLRLVLSPRLVVNGCPRQPPCAAAAAAAATLSRVCCATLVWWEGRYSFLCLFLSCPPVLGCRVTWALTPRLWSCRGGCELLPADLAKVVVEKGEWQVSG